MIKLTKKMDEAQFVTHAGTFHADDVFSTVFLSKLYGDITVIRLDEYKDDGSKLAYDIGLKKFDHHGKDYNEMRDNKIHYCSFGLLWRESGLEFLKKNNIENANDVFHVFDYLLVNHIDAVDNGEFSIESDFNVYTIPDIIELFRSEDLLDEDFLKACDFASLLFDMILKEAVNKVNNIEKIKNLIPTIKNKVLILEKYIPFEYAIFYLNLDIDFVIYPSRGGYAAKTISTSYKGFEPKVPFPKEWGGLRDNDLVKVTGVKSAKFCHNKLFLATAQTLEDAQLLVKKAIKNKKTH